MSKLPAIGQVHLATFLFGLPGLFVISTGLDPVVITFGRTLFAAIALLLAWRLLGLDAWPVFGRWTVLSGIALAVHWCLFFTSIQVSTVAVGLIMFSVSPIFIALLEPVFFREPFVPGNVVPALVVVVGIVVMTGLHSGQIKFGEGVSWGVASSLVFALLQLLNKKLGRSQSPASLVLAQNGIACCLLLPFVYSGLPEITSGQWVQLVFLGIFCTAFAYTLFINSMRFLSVAVTSLIAAGLEPVYGVLLAALLFAQYPDANVLVGGVIVLATVVYVSVKRREG